MTLTLGSTPELATRRRRLAIALGIYLAYTALLATANALNAYGARSSNPELWEMIAGMLMGFLAIPLFSIALPLWLARRWQLEYAFWPRRKNWLLAAAVVALYTLIANAQTLPAALGQGTGWGDLAIHFLSTSWFHVTYYPLFAVLLFPVLRQNSNAGAAVVLTGALFALYHLAQFYYFPAGLSLWWQALLALVFIADLLLYLWSESIILVALGHCVGGSLGMAAEGTLFNQVDAFFAIALATVAALFLYMIVFSIRRRDRPYREWFWLQTRLG